MTAIIVMNCEHAHALFFQVPGDIDHGRQSLKRDKQRDLELANELEEEGRAKLSTRLKSLGRWKHCLFFYCPITHIS